MTVQERKDSTPNFPPKIQTHSNFLLCIQTCPLPPQQNNFSSSNRGHLVMHKQMQQLTHLHSPGEWAGIVLFLGTLATTARPAGLWAPSLSPYLSCFQLEVAFYSGWPYIWNNIVQSLRKILFPKSQESRQNKKLNETNHNDHNGKLKHAPVTRENIKIRTN